ncbi:ABC transporter substrate-binding protein [Alicyclobacillus shizuokensis]|uniref:ABC transporter substrate-binding protein n=1 Tax=Alicyclobacillus shizuokensis TaxID=392014 RepID=UPI000830B709|nr:sugar ABC transporter substrate-binding protein [Alicyclobacillus shizuokensis]MCL6625257.1 sugar ABC transporter substrate-binding protein [Alicyclobacillus shizuokensis]
MKRHSVVAAGIVGLFLVSGCGGAPPTTSGGGNSDSNGQNAEGSSNGLSWSGTSDPSLKGQTITVLWTDTNGIRGKLLKQFTKDTGIKVKEIGVDYNSVYNKVTTAAMARSSDIDVVEMDTIWAGQYYKGNIAVDLTHVIPKDVQDKFTPSSLSAASYDGHLMGIPWFSSSKHLFWNKELFKEAGLDPNRPPKTYDEFLKDSKIIQSKLGGKGIYASGWSWKQAESLTCDYVGFLGAYGGAFFDKNNKPIFDTGGGLQGLKEMVTLMKSGTVDPASLQWDEQDVANAFMAGKIAMMSNWEEGDNLNDPKQSKIAGKWAVGLLPGEGQVTSAACTGSEGLAIMKTSKHKEAALAFLKWIAGDEYQTMEYKQEGQYPSVQALYTKLSSSDKSGLLLKFDEQFKYGVNRPNAPGYVQWSDIISARLHDALLGQGTPEYNLKVAANEVQSQEALSSSQ